MPVLEKSYIFMYIVEIHGTIVTGLAIC